MKNDITSTEMTFKKAEGKVDIILESLKEGKEGW